MYNTSLLNFIGGGIGPIAKIDWNTDIKVRGQFARLAIFVDLGQPLISNIKIDDRIQSVEYESLWMLPRETSRVLKCVEEERYDPWMLIERRQKKWVKLVLAKIGRATLVGERNGSRFEFLSGDLDDNPEGLAKRQVTGKLKARNKIRGKSANKRKLILIEGGPKVGHKVLKPSNSLGGPLLGLA
ncbi:hypothetical protein Goari_022462 [Gossypium aridum]|uniref:Uncharacterized protein n=1 Tax=Gossypium aridum TaxID=34290 RepID=A0A7J8YS49_GOSAI|nr:hypothetical protein [Gossypium aridum]